MSVFTQRLAAASKAHHSLVCVGLDPDPDLMPVSDVLEFNKAIVDSTKDLVCAYKPNLAHYEALGLPGVEALHRTVAYIRSSAPDAIVIGDGKHGDIASTSYRYARALFDVVGFDATTVVAYAGGESLEPFFDYESKGIFVWCRSSNPGAKEFQDLAVSVGAGTLRLFEWIAERAVEWNTRGNVGLVVGSTYPDELGVVRKRCPGLPILLPGIGAQGGDLEGAVNRGLDAEEFNLLISSSRGIIYASRDEADYADAARTAAADLRDRINRVMEQEGRGW